MPPWPPGHGATASIAQSNKLSIVFLLESSLGQKWPLGDSYFALEAVLSLVKSKKAVKHTSKCMNVTTNICQNEANRKSRENENRLSGITELLMFILVAIVQMLSFIFHLKKIHFILNSLYRMKLHKSDLQTALLIYNILQSTSKYNENICTNKR